MQDGEERRKRLLWRAWRRGFKEADLVLGGYADARLATLGAAELDEFERILAWADQDLYPILIGRAPTPPELEGPVMAEIQSLAHFKDGLWSGVSKGG